MKSEFGTNPSDAGMCSHGNFIINCATCASEQKITKSREEVRDQFKMAAKSRNQRRSTVQKIFGLAKTSDMDIAQEEAIKEDLTRDLYGKAKDEVEEAMHSERTNSIISAHAHRGQEAVNLRNLKYEDARKIKNEVLDKQKIKTERIIASVARELHDEWRQSRWIEESGNYDSKVEKTKDLEWSRKNKGATEVDIANTSYEDLPSDWQVEGKASAEVAITEVEAAMREGRQLDDAFIEEASSALHDKWLERNGSSMSPDQNKPYSELAEEEKEKDRVIIRKAIEACAERDFEPVNFQGFNEPGGFKDQYGLDSKLFVVKDRVYGTLKIGGYELEFNGEPTIDDINELFSNIDRSFGYRGDKRHEDEVLSYGYMIPYAVVGRNINGLYERLGIDKKVK